MLRILQVTGKDAADFLHRLTAGSVKPLAVGQGTRGLLLNGQSRMFAQFDLLRVEASAFLLVAPEPCFDRLREELEKMHFAEAIEWSERAGRAFPKVGGSEAPLRFSLVEESDALEWPSPVPGYVFTTQEQNATPQWEFDRISNLVPWPPQDWSDSTPALEAGVLPWIDRDKGCYPGQEVVERSLNVGHPARVLQVYEGVVEVSAGDKLSFEGGGEGVVTSSARREGVIRALVRVPWAKKDATLPGWQKIRSHW